ncbi:amino acid ABC transporter ATP-binding protein [Komagataeibacter xylinus]|uniref:amino acid ABC transporter ATP-binding protein n=1 Tax=Komagataeibacter xylinus TaxID=28448 RepID=UPI001F108F90|nr:ATP-binding cassette domain-containing protein [Komagataeibacter xylinus]
MSYLEFRNVQASYGANPILLGVDLDIEKGEIVSLIGPSGSGKSTMLRVLIGLTPLSGGEIRLEGKPIDYATKAGLRAVRSRMAMVFQSFGLFDHLTVEQNLLLAPTVVGKKKRAPLLEEMHEVLRLTDMQGHEGKRPPQLSGGQKQRIAIARALMLHPEILLMDEPTSALDPIRIAAMSDLFGKLAAQGVTIIQVSHNMDVVRSLSDRIVLMHDGRIAATASPKRDQDDNAAIARFMAAEAHQA